MNKIEAFWNQFLKDTGRDLNTKYTCYFHFELTEKLANELLELVLQGKKRATASSLYAYQIEGEALPQVGEFSIVTDWNNNPQCVIETMNITIIPYKDMTYDICKREGEDDTLESWQKGHKKFFEAEGKIVGYTFDENMSVVFEDFRVIYQR